MTTDPLLALGTAMFVTGLAAIAFGLWNHNLLDIGTGVILVLLPTLSAMSGRRRVSSDVSTEGR